MPKKSTKSFFKEYINQDDPEKKERAIGLQSVDGLRVSDFLLEIARRNIEGEISMDEAQKLIEAHYQKINPENGDKNGDKLKGEATINPTLNPTLN
ncbi:MAG: antitoxin VbhA family protein [Fibrobacter sp.]|nr:antitoxin VbhA family protein [Fibrobacter sp.]